MNRTKQITAIVEGIVAGVPDHVELTGIEVNLRLVPPDNHKFVIRLIRPEGGTTFAIQASRDPEYLRMESRSIASLMPPAPEATTP